MLGCHWPFFADTNSKILVLRWQRTESIFVWVWSLLWKHVDITFILTVSLSILQLGNWLWHILIILFSLLSIVIFYLSLFCSEVNLMTLLCLNSPWHLNFAPIIADGLIPSKLIIEPVWIHVLLNSINNANNVIDISFKFLTFLKRSHADQVRFLVSDRVKVPVMFLWAFNRTFTLFVRRFWFGRPFLYDRVLLCNWGFIDGGSLVLDGSQVTDNWILLFPFVFKPRFDCAVSSIQACYWSFDYTKLICK